VKKLIVTIIAVIGIIAFVLPGCAPSGPALPSPYIGSGALDGNGIPVGFFNDTNTRIGFCYAFDYDTFIHEAMQDQGVQRGSPVVEGLYGYCATTPMYSYCTTLAKYYLENSGWGNLSDIGFKLTLTYNTGNLVRKAGCDLLAAGVNEISSKIVVSVAPLAWPTFLAASRAKKLPLYELGWLPDYPHADDFIVPYMASTGTFSGRCGYGNASLDAQIKAALLDTNMTTQLEKYAALQLLYYNDAPGIVTAQPIARRYFTGHISGFYYNPCESSYPGRYLDLTKSYNSSCPIPYLHNGTFIYQTIGDAESLDPAWCYDTASGQDIEQMYETLIYWNRTSTSNFIPLLATDTGTYNSTDDTLRFTIRSGVQFWNGDNLTAADVKYSFERLMVLDHAAGPAWMVFGPLCGANVGVWDDTNFTAIDNSMTVDGNDVVFHLSDPAYLLPFKQILCGEWASIVDKNWCITTMNDWNGTEADIARIRGTSGPTVASDTKLYQTCMGTGPWILDTWDQGVSITMDENPSYWGGTVPFARVETDIVTGWPQRRLALQGGDADIVDVMATNFADADAINGTNRYIDLPSLSIDAFCFNFKIGG
jgi:ABC-type transport system substrate-binding protein